MEENKDYSMVGSTMAKRILKKLIPTYLIIKIGDEVYSTTFGNLIGSDFITTEIWDTDTNGIGRENCVYLKGSFTETKGHNRISRKPFEINLYCDKFYEETKSESKDNEKCCCDRCGEHLYCPKCQRYTWKTKNI